MSRVTIGIALLLLWLGMNVWAVTLSGLGWLLIYPAASFFTAGIAYLATDGWQLGKGFDGRRAWWAGFPYGPFLALTWVAWRLATLRREPAVEVSPGVWLGRRPTRRDVPPGGVDLVLDVTAEFPPLRVGRDYRCLPLLDGSAGPPSEVLAAVDDAAGRGSVLIHCAQGRGRSAMVTAGVLIARGVAATADEALGRVRAARPRVRLNAEQRRQLDRLAAALRQPI